MDDQKHVCIMEKGVMVTIIYTPPHVLALFTAMKQMPSYNGHPDGSIIVVKSFSDFEKLSSDYPGCFSIVEPPE